MAKDRQMTELKTRLTIFGDINDSLMPYYNPSLAWHNKQLKISIRKCNFTTIKDGAYKFLGGDTYSKTDVLLGDVDPDTLEITNLTKLKISKDAPNFVQLSGLEDVRLFSRKDGLHAVGFQSDRITKARHNESASMGEYLIKDNTLHYLTTLEKPKKEAVEKNWNPADKPSTLFDFTYSDTQVWKDGKLIGEPSKTQIHGGTQLLKQKNGTYLSIVHDKVLDPKMANMSRYRRASPIYDKYIYRNYVAEHGKDGIITKISKPFNFGTGERIEFVQGMVEHKGSMLISMGIRDAKFAIARIDKSELVKLLEVV